MLGRSPPTPFAWLPPSMYALRRDAVFLGLVAILVVLTLASPAQARNYSARIDWPTLGVLAGLLLLTRGVEASGALQWVGRRLIALTRSERTTAISLVAASALISMVVTNDVALFVVVPLTIGIGRFARLPVTRLVVFEALAVNVGSALTPIGNPQNIFLWQRSGVSFGTFVAVMAPLVAVLAVVLLGLALAAFRGRRVPVRDAQPDVSIDGRLLAASLALYVPFLILADRHLVGWAIAVVALAFAITQPRLVRDIDWGLLIVFALMFVDLRSLADLPLAQRWIAGLGLESPARLFVAGVAASQVVSNVPATIALAEYSNDWRTIAYAVNAGGFGLAIGSLANLIALRMLRNSQAWRVFHAWSLPFLLFAAVAAYLIRTYAI